MGKPNFSFQKRQKELVKKRKNEEKRQRKLAAKNTAALVADQQHSAEIGADNSDGAIDGNV